METDLNELHNLANTAFQNVSNLTPALRHLVANAKLYQKSVQATCNLAVMFIESLQSIATAATASEGSTKKLGDVLIDIIDAFKEIENMKLELTKLFINELIIPLESKAENEINNTKSTHKSYNQENKIQTELVEKARAGVSKVRKKSVKKKKPSTKLDEKEKTNVQTLDQEESKLKKVREEGLRKALIEERRMYCFVAERMCSYGRGMVVYNNRISNFVNQKIPDWQSYISKPTELPIDSESIITNPTGYKMGTVRGKLSKSEKKESLKRGKSFNTHFPTKYSTMDGRASRGGSRPSLAAFTITSATSNNSLSNPTTPSPRAPAPRSPNSNGKTGNSLFPTPPQSVKDGESLTDSSRGVSPAPTSESSSVQIGLYIAPTPDTVVLASQSPPQSEYANLVLLNNEEESMVRSQSVSTPKNSNTDREGSFNRTESAAGDLQGIIKPPPLPDQGDFASKLAMIQNQLSQTLSEKSNLDASSRQCLKALYKHEAQDASQLSFEKDDIIIPVCEPTAGWQYGENEKTNKSGWFPAAFTEEVVVSSTGETKAANSRVISSVRKPPPVLAKKASRSSTSRKISVACTQLVHPSKGQEVVRRGSHGDIPHIPTSSSVPEMMHALAENKGHHRKHSNSFQGIDHNHDEDSFDDSVEDLTHLNEKKDSIDAMPPPPPPPIWDEESNEDNIELPVHDIEKPFNGVVFQKVESD